MHSLEYVKHCIKTTWTDDFSSVKVVCFSFKFVKEETTKSFMTQSLTGILYEVCLRITICILLWSCPARNHGVHKKYTYTKLLTKCNSVHYILSTYFTWYYVEQKIIWNFALEFFMIAEFEKQNFQILFSNIMLGKFRQI